MTFEGLVTLWVDAAWQATAVAIAAMAVAKAALERPPSSGRPFWPLLC